MGHVEHGGREVVADALQAGEDARAQRGVEGGEGLVEQQEGRRRREGAGEGDPLALSAGQAGGAAVEQRAELEQRDDLRDRLVPSRLRAVEDVAPHVHVGEEGEVLGHVADAPAVARHVHAGLGVEEGARPDADRPAARPAQTGDGLEHRGLARPRRAEQGDGPRLDALAHLEREAALAQGEVEGDRPGSRRLAGHAAVRRFDASRAPNAMVADTASITAAAAS